MAIDPVIICLTRAGEKTAHTLAAAFQYPIHGRKARVDQADVFFENALDHVRDLFAAGYPIIGVCASGILIRAVAPLLNNKTIEPPVVSVADDGSVVVPLLGGHRGANRLARKIADRLSAQAAMTTAGDLALGVALDEPPPGYRVSNQSAAKTVMAGLLNGAPYHMAGCYDWLEPVAKLGNVTCGTFPSVKGVRKPPVSLNRSKDERISTAPEDFLVFHQIQFTLGVGCARNCDPGELETLVSQTLEAVSIPVKELTGIFSLDLKADEPAMLHLAQKTNLPFRVFTATELETQKDKLANPSDIVFAEVGCHGVSEAAALMAAGPDGELIMEKQKSANATCAIARSKGMQPITHIPGRSRGKLSIVGIGPGQAAWRTPEVSRLIAEADELVGYGLYLDLLGPLAHGKKQSDFQLGAEEDRCRYALEQAGTGKNIALVCSGDAGIYAMSALVFELMSRDVAEKGVSDAARRAEVCCSPGISALQAAAARAGAPLGHDFCAISLSDLLTQRTDILKRLHAAAEGDFVVAFYNPVSKRRRTLLAEARDILLHHRASDTPVVFARALGRPDETVTYCRLADLDVEHVDMMTVVLIGSSQSQWLQLGDGTRIYTPRGYARKMDGELL